MIPIYGFNTTSEAGQCPEAISIFVSGCNLRCPYCMNARLVKEPDTLDEEKLESITSYIEDNDVPIVFISGGEPLIHKDIIDLITYLKEYGVEIGLSTNGSFTDRLKTVLPYVNYVALDVKSWSSVDYEKMGGSSEDYEKMCESAECLRKRKSSREDFSYELRTTLYPEFANLNTIPKFSHVIKKEDLWILQEFRKVRDMMDDNAKKVIKDKDTSLSSIIREAKQICDNVKIRYV